MEYEAIQYYYIPMYIQIITLFSIFGCIISTLYFLTLWTSDDFYKGKNKNTPLVLSIISAITGVILGFVMIVIPTSYIRLKAYNFIACNDTSIKKLDDNCIGK